MAYNLNTLVDVTFIKNKIAIRKGESYRFKMPFVSWESANSWMEGVNKNSKADYRVNSIVEIIMEM